MQKLLLLNHISSYNFTLNLKITKNLSVLGFLMLDISSNSISDFFLKNMQTFLDITLGNRLN